MVDSKNVEIKKSSDKTIAQNLLYVPNRKDENLAGL